MQGASARASVAGKNHTTAVPAAQPQGIVSMENCSCLYLTVGVSSERWVGVAGVSTAEVGEEVANGWEEETGGAGGGREVGLVELLCHGR